MGWRERAVCHDCRVQEFRKQWASRGQGPAGEGEPSGWTLLTEAGSSPAWGSAAWRHTQWAPCFSPLPGAVPPNPASLWDQPPAGLSCCAEEQAGSWAGQVSLEEGGRWPVASGFCTWCLSWRRLHSRVSDALKNGSSFCPKEAAGSVQRGCDRFWGTTRCSKGGG